MPCQYYYNGKSYSKEELINLINEGKVADEQKPEILYTIYDQDILRSLMNIDETSSLEDYLSSNYPDQLKKVKKYNPNVSFSFDETKALEFDAVTNTVNISLSSIYEFAN